MVKLIGTSSALLLLVTFLTSYGTEVEGNCCTRRGAMPCGTGFRGRPRQIRNTPVNDNRRYCCPRGFTEQVFDPRLNCAAGQGPPSFFRRVANIGTTLGVPIATALGGNPLPLIAAGAGVFGNNGIATVADVAQSLNQIASPVAATRVFGLASLAGLAAPNEDSTPEIPANVAQCAGRCWEALGNYPPAHPMQPEQNTTGGRRGRRSRRRSRRTTTPPPPPPPTDAQYGAWRAQAGRCFLKCGRCFQSPRGRAAGTVGITEGELSNFCARFGSA